MSSQLLGREEEKKSIATYCNSAKAEFIAVYGRRRVGKTYLIKQYFKNVGTNLDNPFLVVNTELADYTIFNTPVPDNQKVTLQLKVEVLYKNNVILAKTYNSEVKDFIIVGWDLTPTSNTFEKLHKGLLNVYETDFKKDLIESLKNKM